MEFDKTINSTADVLFDFAVSIILIPRTLLKVLRNPCWSISYVSSQFSEKPKSRYEKYSSPILFWVVIGVLPYYFIINTYFQGFTDNKSLLEVYTGIGSVRIVGGLAILLVSFPLSCAFILQLFKYKGFMVTTFKKSFYNQLYLTAPVQLFYTLIFFEDKVSDTWIILFLLVSIGIVIWFLIAELLVIKRELGYNWWVCIGILGLMYLIFFVFAGICTVIAALINMDIFRQIVNAVFDDIELFPKK